SVGHLMEGGGAGRDALVALAVGTLGTGLFTWRQIALGRTDRALLDLRPLSHRNYTLSLVVLLLLFGAMLGVLNTLPLYMQGSLLVSALVAGLVLLPGGLLEGFLSPLAGRLFDRYGPRPLVVPGMVITTVSLGALSLVDEHSSVLLVVALHV